MFKRVAKRQRKREEEEELGLDEDMKQVLGLQDTDSDESQDSDSDSESGNDSDLDSISGEGKSDADAPSISLKRKRSARGVHFDPESDSDGTQEEGNLSELGIPETDSAEEEVEDDDSPPMGVIAATTNPIYDVPGAPPSQDLRSCVVCPGKLLKSTKMTKVHVESTAHLRRLQRYTDHVSKLVSGSGGLTTDDPREILLAISGDKTPEARNPDASSKRSQRKALWKVKQAERKARSKAKAKKGPNLGEEKDSVVAPVVDVQSDRTDDKSKKSGKMIIGAKDVPVSIALDLPSSPQRRVARDGKAKSNKGKDHEFATASGARPTKRPRRDKQAQTDTSSRGDTSAQGKPALETVGGQSQGGHRAPRLKRHNTSLYFADDEKVLASLGQRYTQSSSANKNGMHDSSEKVISMSETKRRPRDDRPGVLGQGIGVAKEGRQKNESRSDSTGHSARPLYRKREGEKGLSAKQWGGGQVLQIYE